MRGLLASPRRRRRLAWAGAALLAAGVAVGLVFAFPAPDEAPQTLVEDTTPLPREPAEERLSRRERASMLTVAADFVRTAVARKHLAHSYDLVAPNLRHGYTRTSWARGDIPVVPFPVRQAKWKLSYSDAKEVGLQVALFPRRHADVRAAVFDLTLVRRAAGGHGRWLVSAFSPSPVAGALDDEELTPLGTPRLSPVSTGRGPLGAAWLAIPLGVVGLALLGLAGFGAAAWYRGRRARRIAAAERQTSSSSPS